MTTNRPTRPAEPRKSALTPRGHLVRPWRPGRPPARDMETTHGLHSQCAPLVVFLPPPNTANRPTSSVLFVVEYDSIVADGIGIAAGDLAQERCGVPVCVLPAAVYRGHWPDFSARTSLSCRLHPAAVHLPRYVLSTAARSPGNAAG